MVISKVEDKSGPAFGGSSRTDGPSSPGGSVRPRSFRGVPPALSREEETARSARIVSEILERPETGLALLYEAYCHEVNRLVWRLLGADTEHDDLVQLVFLHLLRGAHRIRNPETLTAWVRRVTVNIVRSQLRKRYVRRLFAVQPPPEEVHPDLRDQVEAREIVQRSAQVLAKIPPGERIVFLLYYAEGATLPEIGQMCGYSAMTAKRRLAQARGRFNRLSEREPQLTGLSLRKGTKP